VETVEQVLAGRPESLPSANLDGRDGDVDGVDEIRLEELPHSGDTAANPYVLPLSGVLGLPHRLLGRGIDVVSASVKLGR